MDCRLQRWQANRCRFPILRMAHRSESFGKCRLPRWPQNRMGPAKSAGQKCSRSRQIHPPRIPQRLESIRTTDCTDATDKKIFLKSMVKERTFLRLGALVAVLQNDRA